MCVPCARVTPAQIHRLYILFPIGFFSIVIWKRGAYGLLCIREEKGVFSMKNLYSLMWLYTLLCWRCLYTYTCAIRLRKAYTTAALAALCSSRAHQVCFCVRARYEWLDPPQPHKRVNRREKILTWTKDSSKGTDKEISGDFFCMVQPPSRCAREVTHTATINSIFPERARSILKTHYIYKREERVSRGGNSIVAQAVLTPEREKRREMPSILCARGGE